MLLLCADHQRDENILAEPSRDNPKLSGIVANAGMEFSAACEIIAKKVNAAQVKTWREWQVSIFKN